MNGSSFGSADPIRELDGVGRGSTEKHHPNVVGKHDDNFFPYYTSLGVVNVMHLIKDNPLDIPDKVSAAVEHTSEYFGSHDKVRPVWVDLHVSRDESDLVLAHSFTKISIFLIG